MNPINVDFLASALCERGVASTLEEFQDRFASRRQAQRIIVERIPFQAMKGWSFKPSTGNLAHETGRFFKIEGVWVETNYGFKPQWSQPIINQPEIGILGILAKKMGRVLHFLMQADNIVNMCTRTVRSNIGFGNHSSRRRKNQAETLTCPARDSFAVFFQGVIQAIERQAWQHWSDAVLQDARFLNQLKTSAGVSNENQSMGLFGRV